MTDTRKEELIKQITACFEEHEQESNKTEVTIEVRSGYTSIEIYRMYKYLPMNFGIIAKLAEILGTENFNVNQESFDGCETCDYGSKYIHTIYLPFELK